MKIRRAAKDEKREDGSRKWALVDFDHADDALSIRLSKATMYSLREVDGRLVVIAHGGAVEVRFR